jgi:hypothetical protein
LAMEKHLIRFTRERLLSMRPRPEEMEEQDGDGGRDDNDGVPAIFQNLGGTSLFSKRALDPGKITLLMVLWWCC